MRSILEQVVQRPWICLQLLDAQMKPQLRKDRVPFTHSLPEQNNWLAAVQ